MNETTNTQLVPYADEREEVMKRFVQAVSRLVSNLYKRDAWKLKAAYRFFAVTLTAILAYQIYCIGIENIFINMILLIFASALSIGTSMQIVGSLYAKYVWYKINKVLGRNK